MDSASSSSATATSTPSTSLAAWRTATSHALGTTLTFGLALSAAPASASASASSPDAAASPPDTGAPMPTSTAPASSSLLVLAGAGAAAAAAALALARAGKVWGKRRRVEYAPMVAVVEDTAKPLVEPDQHEHDREGSASTVMLEPLSSSGGSEAMRGKRSKERRKRAKEPKAKVLAKVMSAPSAMTTPIASPGLFQPPQSPPGEGCVVAEDVPLPPSPRPISLEIPPANVRPYSPITTTTPSSPASSTLASTNPTSIPTPVSLTPSRSMPVWVDSLPASQSDPAWDWDGRGVSPNELPKLPASISYDGPYNTSVLAEPQPASIDPLPSPAQSPIPPSFPSSQTVSRIQHDEPLFPTLNPTPPPNAHIASLRAALDASRGREEQSRRAEDKLIRQLERVNREAEKNRRECDILRWKVQEERAAFARREAELVAQIQRMAPVHTQVSHTHAAQSPHPHAHMGHVPVPVPMLQYRAVPVPAPLTMGGTSSAPGSAPLSPSSSMSMSMVAAMGMAVSWSQQQQGYMQQQLLAHQQMLQQPQQQQQQMQQPFLHAHYQPLTASSSSGSLGQSLDTTSVTSGSSRAASPFPPPDHARQGSYSSPGQQQATGWDRFHVLGYPHSHSPSPLSSSMGGEDGAAVGAAVAEAILRRPHELGWAKRADDSTSASASSDTESLSTGPECEHDEQSEPAPVGAPCGDTADDEASLASDGLPASGTEKATLAAQIGTMQHVW